MNYKEKKIEELTDQELIDYRKHLDDIISEWLGCDDMMDEEMIQRWHDAKLEELIVLVEMEERSKK